MRSPSIEVCDLRQDQEAAPFEETENARLDKVAMDL
jgi:hypothetical protein